MMQNGILLSQELNEELRFPAPLLIFVFTTLHMLPPKFAEITAVPFPAVYNKFLSFIEIFSFDLGWILSAACITVGFDFYDELL